MNLLSSDRPAVTVRRRTILQNIALLAGSVLLTLGAAEGMLRLFPGLMTEAALLRVHWYRTVDLPTVSVAHPYIGFLYHPYDHVEHRRGKLSFSYRLDQYGFRNPMPWPDSADIVVLGDSWTFGYGVEDDEGWVARLADRLPRRSVINLGLIGSGPEQYVRVFETFGAALEPKLVIFGVFPGNDVRDTRTFRQWLHAGRPGNYDEWRFFGGHPPGLRRTLQQRSYLLVLWNEIVKDWNLPFAGSTIEFPDGGRLRLAPSAIARNAALAVPENRDFQGAIGAILQGQELARAGSADFVVLLYPTKEEVYLPVMGESSPDAVGPFVTALEQRGVPFIDLRPAMRERARAGDRLYFEIDGHANEAGYRLIADTVMAWLAGRLEGPDRDELVVRVGRRGARDTSLDRTDGARAARRR